MNEELAILRAELSAAKAFLQYVADETWTMYMTHWQSPDEGVVSLRYRANGLHARTQDMLTKLGVPHVKRQDGPIRCS